MIVSKVDIVPLKRWALRITIDLAWSCVFLLARHSLLSPNVRNWNWVLSVRVNKSAKCIACFMVITIRFNYCISLKHPKHICIFLDVHISLNVELLLVSDPAIVLYHLVVHYDVT